MALSNQSIEALMELVEIKLGCVEIFDREDAREVKALERCHNELLALGGKDGATNVINIPRKKRRPAPAPQAQAV
jgi:hypothetical protein